MLVMTLISRPAIGQFQENLGSEWIILVTARGHNFDTGQQGQKAVVQPQIITLQDFPLKSTEQSNT